MTQTPSEWQDLKPTKHEECSSKECGNGIYDDGLCYPCWRGEGWYRWNPTHSEAKSQ